MTLLEVLVTFPKDTKVQIYEFDTINPFFTGSYLKAIATLPRLVLNTKVAYCEDYDSDIENPYYAIDLAY